MLALDESSSALLVCFTSNISEICLGNIHPQPKILFKCVLYFLFSFNIHFFYFLASSLAISLYDKWRKDLKNWILVCNTVNRNLRESGFSVFFYYQVVKIFWPLPAFIAAHSRCRVCLSIANKRHVCIWSVPPKAFDILIFLKFFIWSSI